MTLETKKLIHKEDNLLVVDFTPRSMSATIEFSTDTALDQINSRVQDINQYWDHDELDELTVAVENLIDALAYYKQLSK